MKINVTSKALLVAFNEENFPTGSYFEHNISPGRTVLCYVFSWDDKEAEVLRFDGDPVVHLYSPTSSPMYAPVDRDTVELYYQSQQTE